MSQVVKVRIRPGQSLRFPPICVSCTRPASERLKIRKESGRAVRLIEVPLCGLCARELSLKSMEEERWGRFGLAATGATGLVALALLLLLRPDGLNLVVWLLFSLPMALLLASGVYRLVDRKRRAAARPEKKAILDAVEMVDFSWRATVFSFNNETFAERFIAMNEPLLMEA